MKRNLSTNAYFCALAEKHMPKFRFADNNKDDWQQWKDQLLPTVKASLGVSFHRFFGKVTKMSCAIGADLFVQAYGKDAHPNAKNSSLAELDIATQAAPRK